MELEVYLKKRMIYGTFLFSLAILIAGIIGEVNIAIIGGILLTLVAILLMKTYLFKPALVIGKNSFHFQGIYGKNVQYDFDQIESIIFDQQHKEIEIKHKSVKHDITIKDSYNVSITKIYKDLQSKTNRG